MLINKELNQAILSSLMGKYSLYVFQVLSLAILARIFTPEMFGVVAAFQVFILFFQLLATSGLAPAIIYKNSLSSVERDGVFSFMLLVGMIGAGLFFFLTPYLSSWLGIDDVAILSWVFAFNVLFSSLSVVPMASLQKDAKFIVLNGSEIISEVISLILTLFLFYIGYEIEALASKLLFVPVFRFVFYYFGSKQTTLGRPSLGRKISSVSVLYEFAKYQLAFNVFNYFSRNLDTILIAKYFGVAVVGFYEKSYQVMRYPLQLFTFAITPALQPILTKYKHRLDLVESAYYPVVLKLALLGFFVSWVLFWGARHVVYIMFGPQWQQVAEYLSILAVSIPLQMVLSSTGGVYQAVGEARLQFYCGVFSGIVNVLMILIGVYLGDIALLCLLLVVGFVVNFIQCFWMLQVYVFNSKKYVYMFLISVVVLFPYLNLIFIGHVNRLSEMNFAYFDSFLTLFCIASGSFVFTFSIFLVIKRFVFRS